MEEGAYVQLNDRQRAFVDAYTGPQLGNGTRAAQAAGYSERSASALAYQLLRMPKIREAIRERTALVGMGAEEVLIRLAQQARADWSEFLGADGEVDLEKLKAAGLMHLVKGTRFDRRGRLIVEFHDAQAALVQLGRYHALFTDRQEHSGDPAQPVTVAILRGVSTDDL